MGFDITGLGSVFDFGSKIIDKLWPDKSEAERAKLKLIELQQAGEFKEMDARFSAIVAEANSNDPWTSRARPSFMYVMYLMILAAIPMGFMFAFRPEVAMAVTSSTCPTFSCRPACALASSAALTWIGAVVRPSVRPANSTSCCSAANG